jgi:hypothetical protein
MKALCPFEAKAGQCRSRRGGFDADVRAGCIEENSDKTATMRDLNSVRIEPFGNSPDLLVIGLGKVTLAHFRAHPRHMTKLSRIVVANSGNSERSKDREFFNFPI